jgi:hypothetical protein
MAPPDAERMSSWISEDMVPMVASRIILGQQRPSADGAGPSEARLHIRHMEVQMDLLRVPVGPLRRTMLRRVLHTDHPLTRMIDHTVEGVVFVNDAPTEQPRPKRAHLADVSGVQHNDVSHQIHKIRR